MIRKSIQYAIMYVNSYLSMNTYLRKFDKRMRLSKHVGIWRKEMSLWEGVALITSGTIGAGLLAIPYAVSQVGISIGLLYIFGIGILMIGLNLLIGEISIRTKENFQLPGLAKKYLGNWAGKFMTGIIYSMLFGVQLVYIIGTGESLEALFGGNPVMWSLVFFALAALPIIVGLRTVKVVEVVLMVLILSVVLIISSTASSYIKIQHFSHVNLASLLHMESFCLGIMERQPSQKRIAY